MRCSSRPANRCWRDRQTVTAEERKHAGTYVDIGDAPPTDPEFDYEAMRYEPRLPGRGRDRLLSTDQGGDAPEAKPDDESPPKPTKGAPSKASPLRLVPATHYPDYPCDEYEGAGWLVRIVNKSDDAVKPEKEEKYSAPQAPPSKHKWWKTAAPQALQN